jgi:hypothetical protein
MSITMIVRFRVTLKNKLLHKNPSSQKRCESIGRHFGFNMDAKMAAKSMVVCGSREGSGGVFGIAKTTRLIDRNRLAGRSTKTDDWVERSDPVFICASLAFFMV